MFRARNLVNSKYYYYFTIKFPTFATLHTHYIYVCNVCEGLKFGNLAERVGRLRPQSRERAEARQASPLKAGRARGRSRRGGAGE